MQSAYINRPGQLHFMILVFLFFLLVLVRSSVSNFYFIVKLKQVQNIVDLTILIYPLTPKWLTWNFSLKYPYTMWQTGNENTQTNQAEDVILIHHQILITNCEGYV